MLDVHVTAGTGIAGANLYSVRGEAAAARRDWAWLAYIINTPAKLSLLSTYLVKGGSGGSSAQGG